MARDVMARDVMARDVMARDVMPRGVIGVCWKFVELRSSVDPLTGAVVPDPLSAGASPADEAALEWALRAAEVWQADVVVASAISGPAASAVSGPAAGDRGDGREAPGRGLDQAVVSMLRGALSAGATRVVAVEVAAGPPGEPGLPSGLGPGPLGPPSETVAAGLAAVLDDAGASMVFCGDASIDRGSGSVPAFLAGRLQAAQALGAVGLDIAADGSLQVERRLDQGRRERLFIAPGTRGVVSVEARTARLRRAPLKAVLAARCAAIEVRPPRQAQPLSPLRVASVGPYRPRARIVPPPDSSLPAGERIRLLSGIYTQKPPRLLTLPPPEAAAVLLATLREWGEVAACP